MSNAIISRHQRFGPMLWAFLGDQGAIVLRVILLDIEWKGQHRVFVVGYFDIKWKGHMALLYAQLGPRGASSCFAHLGDDTSNDADHKYPTWRNKDVDEKVRENRFVQEFKVSIQISDKLVWSKEIENIVWRNFTENSSNQDHPLNPAPSCDAILNRQTKCAEWQHFKMRRRIVVLRYSPVCSHLLPPTPRWPRSAHSFWELLSHIPVLCNMIISYWAQCCKIANNMSKADVQSTWILNYGLLYMLASCHFIFKKVCQVHISNFLFWNLLCTVFVTTQYIYMRINVILW